MPSANDYNWTDPATGNPTPPGVGNPTPKTGGSSGSSGGGTVTVGGSTFNMPSYAINPGSVFQTYNPGTGTTSYGSPPAGFAARAAGGSYASVETPLNAPLGTAVYQGPGLGYAPLGPNTRFTIRNIDGVDTLASDYSLNPEKYPEMNTKDSAWTVPPGTKAQLTKPVNLSAGALSSNTLYDFYKATGRALPSLSERGNLYAQYTGKSGYTGTAAQNAELLRSLKGNQLPPTQTPNNAGSITGATTPNVTSPNVVNPDISDVFSILAGSKNSTAAKLSTYEKMAQFAMDAQKSKETRDKPWLDKLLGMKSERDASNDVLNQLGFSIPEYLQKKQAKEAELESLTVDYNNTVAAQQQKINENESRQVSMTMVNARTNRINKEYYTVLTQKASNITAKASSLEALNGNFEVALKLADRAAEYAAADKKNIMEQYQLYKENNPTVYEILGPVYQKVFDDELQRAEDDYKQTKADYLEKMKMGLKYNFDVSPNDSWETVNANARKSPVYRAELAKLTSSGSGGGSSTPEGISIGDEIIPETGDTFTDIINYLDSAKRQGMLNDVTYNAQINGLLRVEGAVPTETGAYSEEDKSRMRSLVNQALEKKDPKKITQTTQLSGVSSVSRLKSPFSLKSSSTKTSTPTTTTSFWSNLFGD